MGTQYHAQEYRELDPPVSEYQGTVLIIDDSEPILSGIRDILENHGFHAALANSARAAIEQLTFNRPDVILCDIMMPDISGYELCEQLQQSPEWCDIPFVFLSALSSQDEVCYGKELGCDDYITKPFDPDQLASVVKGKMTLAKQREQMNKVRIQGYHRRIIHTLSHEFRTPLVSINTGTELLAEQFSKLDTAHVERLIASIRRGGQRLERLVNDFMLLQRIDLGQEAALSRRMRERVALVGLAESGIEAYREAAGEAQREVTLEIRCEEQQCPYVNVFDVQVINIIHRLLSNAEKFSRPSESIIVTVSSGDDWGAISVRDRGPGLGAPIREACEMFSQIDRATNEQQGCGLGLTIADYFARMNSGTLDFSDPEDGKGLVAEIRFPKA